VSEAALYRHFASKAQMYEGLIEFIETTLFTLVNKIAAETQDGIAQAQQIVAVLLGFADKNPGMTRVLIGDALVNEDERLQARMNQLYDPDRGGAAAGAAHRAGERQLARRHDADANVPGRVRARPMAALREERLQAFAAGRLERAAQAAVRVMLHLRSPSASATVAQTPALTLSASGVDSRLLAALRASPLTPPLPGSRRLHRRRCEYAAGDSPAPVLLFFHRVERDQHRIVGSDKAAAAG
jgi:AcrR family transcriptional regulator